MTLRKDPQIVAEQEARELGIALPERSSTFLAFAHRNAARMEMINLVDMISQRNALPDGLARDRLTREIDESQAYIERRLLKAAELDAPQSLAAE